MERGSARGQLWCAVPRRDLTVSKFTGVLSYHLAVAETLVQIQGRGSQSKAEAETEHRTPSN